MKTLEDFLRPTQKQLFKLLAKKFKGKAILSKKNFILVRGTAPVMLVAHLDTVHEKPVKQICASEDGNILMSPQGIGGDDRCGVFALVKIYHAAQVKPWLLFTCDEEIGGLGAKQFCLAHSQGLLPSELDALKFLIEIDRKGKNDAVYYDCDNPDFEEYITGKGFQTAIGSFSDISLLAPELEVAAVNLSSGYYAPHTLHEYVIRTQLENVIQRVGEIVSEASDLPRFEYIEAMPVLSEPLIIDLPNTTTSLPQSVPETFRDIYTVLLDFFSPAELESFRQEYGDHVLWQIYDDEIAPLYRR
ncbi:hypothetical protein IKH79_00580 [Candidatus Saccharibacteria bacterium]|nr:hypothetical protein [Candidatus Saccharibacteria bacterium]